MSEGIFGRANARGCSVKSSWIKSWVENVGGNIREGKLPGECSGKCSGVKSWVKNVGGNIREGKCPGGMFGENYLDRHAGLEVSTCSGNDFWHPVNAQTDRDTRTDRQGY